MSIYYKNETLCNINDINNKIDTEITDRTNADANLQTQIDSINTIISTNSTYIAEGESSGQYRCFIYENNDGIKGSLVATIERNDWQTLSQYAPQIEIALNNVCLMWNTGFGASLNFAKLKKTGMDFMYNCSTFNHQLSFPVLTVAGYRFMYNCTNYNPYSYVEHNTFLFPMLTSVDHGFMKGCTTFNLSLSFPVLTTVGDDFMYNCTALNNVTISFDKLVINSMSLNFLSCQYTTAGKVTLEFKTRQTRTTLPSNFLYSRHAYSNINLCIPSNSTNVDIKNKIWAGETFAKITFIDEILITTIIIAGENLPANRFINFYGYLCGSTDKVLGVTTDACNIGEPAKIVTHGIAIVELSSNIITAGEEIRPSTDGKATMSPLAFQNIINLDSGSAGSLIRVKI